MEENSNQNAFILQTIDLSNSNTEDDLSKECVFNEAPLLISTKEINNASQQYITCYENGEIVLKEQEDSDVEDTKIIDEVTIVKNEIVTSVELKPNSGGVKIVQGLPKVQEIRKKLCYEKPYNIQPSTMHSKPDAQIVSLKHPRKQLIDQKIMISPREFKSQLNYTEDTITTTKLAPCTRQQLLHVLNGITTLFAHPAHKMPNSNLMQLYVSRCTCKKEPNMMATEMEDMTLLPVIENSAKSPTNKTCPPLKRIYTKRRNTAGISVEAKKIQILENKEPNKSSTDVIHVPDSNINLSSIKKIYRNRKNNKEPVADNDKQQIIQSNYINENIDHKYSKKITKESEIDQISIDEPQCDDDTLYTITLDLDNIKEEHISDNQIVILSVDNDGELTENNISVLLDPANNIEIDSSKESEQEVVALTRNVGTEDFNNRISNIFVVRKSNDNNENEQILGDISDMTTS